MLGEIAHAFEGDRQAHGGDHDAQVGGDRVLLGQQLHALVDHAFLQRVEFRIAVDNGLCGFDVGSQQSLTCSANGFAYILCHVVKVVGNGLHLFVENNAHCVCSAFRMCCVQSCTSLCAALPACESRHVMATGSWRAVQLGVHRAFIFAGDSWPLRNRSVCCVFNV